jgi:O-antigen/teichoic acid export membrane protein
LIPVSFVTLFIDWGVTPALIKYLALFRYENKPENRRLIVESALILNTTLGVMFSLVLFFASPYIAQNVFKQPEIAILIKYSSFSIIGNSLLRISWAVAIGYERMELRIGTTIVYSLLKSVAGPILIFLGYGPVGAILGEVGPVLFSSIIGLVFIWILWQSEPPVKPSMNHVEGMFFLLKFGYPLFLSALIGGIIPSLNNFILALNVSNELIGNYTAGIRFSALISFFSMPIATVMFPLFSKLENDSIALKTVYQNSVKFTAIIILPVAAVIIALADQIVIVLYDQGYEYTSLFMKIYMLIFILPGFGQINTGNLLNGLRETHVNLRGSVMSLLINVPLSFILIPRLGVLGLLIAMISGSVSGLLYRLIWVQKKMKFTILWRASIKTFLAAVGAFIISTVFISLIQVNPLIELISGGLVYLASYIAGVIRLKILSPTDLNYIETIFRSLGEFSKIFTLVILLMRKLSGYN